MQDAQLDGVIAPGSQSPASGLVDLIKSGIFVQRLSLEGLAPVLTGVSHPQVVVVGIGFCSHRGVASIATPIELLEMLLAAAQLALVQGIRRVSVLLGASMAEQFGIGSQCPCWRAQVRLRAAEAELVIGRLQGFLKEVRFEIFQDEEVMRTLAYQAEQERVAHFTHPALYAREFAYLIAQAGVFSVLQQRRFMDAEAIKLGWTLRQDSEASPFQRIMGELRNGQLPSMWCEAVFDAFKILVQSSLRAFAHVAPTESFDPAFPRGCPYVVTSPKGRILLREGCDPEEVIAQPTRMRSTDSAIKVAGAVEKLSQWTSLFDGLTPGLLPGRSAYTVPAKSKEQWLEQLRLLRELEEAHPKGSRSYAEQSRRVRLARIKHAEFLREAELPRIRRILDIFVPTA